MSNVNEVIPNQSDHVISDRDHCSALQSVTETAGPAVTTDPTVTTDLIVATGPEVATGPTVTAGTIEPSPDTIDPVDTSNDSVTSSDAVFDKVARCGQDSARGEDYSGLFEHGPSGPADLVIPSMGIAQTQVKGKLRGPVRQWSLQMKLELVNRGVKLGPCCLLLAVAWNTLIFQIVVWNTNSIPSSLVMWRSSPFSKFCMFHRRASSFLTSSPNGMTTHA